MVKITKAFCSVMLIIALFITGFLLAEKHMLQNNIIRLDVVANSDNTSDQQIKLIVRDCVLACLGQAELAVVDDVDVAKRKIADILVLAEQSAKDVLKSTGCNDRVVVTFQKEEYDTQNYDGIHLPAGAYYSVRVEIGKGAGGTLWCVVYPTLYSSAGSMGPHNRKVFSGLDDGLNSVLFYEHGYRMRFFLLECIGNFEKFINNYNDIV